MLIKRNNSHFRLFYLCEDAQLRNIKEESFFRVLTFFHPAICGIFVSMLLGEDFFNTNEFHTSLILYSSCSKIPVRRGYFRGLGVTYFVFTFGHYACFTLTLISLFLCFRRQRQLEKQKFEGIMVVNYHKDGVTISKRSSDLQSCRKLLKHYRTVISPQASLISFITSISIYLIWAFFFFTMDPSGSSVLLPNRYI